MNTTPASPRLSCSCGAICALPECILPSPDPTSPENWDILAPLAAAKGWHILRDPQGRRFAACPACGTLPPLRRLDWCPACGSLKLSTIYCRGDHGGCQDARPHLHRVCRRCGYDWRCSLRQSPSPRAGWLRRLIGLFRR